MRVVAKGAADFFERVTERQGFEDFPRPRIHATDELRDENIPINPIRIGSRGPKELRRLDIVLAVAGPLLELGEYKSLVSLEEVSGQIPNPLAFVGWESGYCGYRPFQQWVSGYGIVQEIEREVLGSWPEVARDAMHLGIHRPEFFLVASL
ncbi:MAG TPA: hypothetical protein VGJ64_04615 [Gemmatimonadaceae bacterium]